jgi:hypothetical protein
VCVSVCDTDDDSFVLFTCMNIVAMIVHVSIP